MLIQPPTYDKTSGLVNCHLNETWLTKNGYTQWTDQQINQWHDENNKTEQIDKTQFNKACSYFRQICQEIGTLIGNNNFKGGFQDMTIFYSHESYKTDKGMQLAIAWSGCNEYCNHEAKKIGLNSPQWWYICWQNSSSSSSNTQPLYYSVQLKCTVADFNMTTITQPDSTGIVMKKDQIITLTTDQTTIQATVPDLIGYNSSGEIISIKKISTHTNLYYNNSFVKTICEGDMDVSKEYTIENSGSIITITHIPIYSL